MIMDSNIFEEIFIDKWKKRDFSAWNEDEVGKWFIVELLGILGYSKGTINDVFTNKHFKLKNSYHRKGQQHIEIDYVPTLKLKYFWIIEAKTGKKKEMDFGTYLQAHYYAIHPEVQARFIVLINGWEIRLYDVINTDDWDDYIIKCTQEDCEKTFPELKKFLHCKSILKSIREYTLNSIKESLMLEIDEEEVNKIKQEVNKIAIEVTPQIKKNAKQLFLNSWKESEKKEKEEIKKASIDDLLIRMDIPINQRLINGIEFVNRILEADKTEQQNLIEKIVKNYRGRPHAIFRVNSTFILCRLIEEEIQVSKSNYINTVQECLEELVVNNFNYWEQNSLSNALCHLDNICIRLSKKFSVRIAMDLLMKLIEDQKKISPKEDQIKTRPSVAKNMLSAIGFLNELLWRRFCSKSKAEDIWNGIWHYQEAEKQLDKMPMPKYPKNDSESSFFEYYGEKIDMLTCGTWDLINNYIKKVDSKKISETIRMYAKNSYDQIIKKLPKPKSKPKDWQFDEKFIVEIFNFIKKTPENS